MNIEQIEKEIASSFMDGKFWVVGGQGSFAFRYGPFEREEVAPILKRAIAEGVGLTIVKQEGRDIDWTLLKELCPATYSDDAKQAFAEDDAQ